MLRDLAKAWFAASFPAGAPIDDWVQNVDFATERGLNCWFRFGPGTTRNGHPYLVYCFEGEFFAFELDRRQADLLQLVSHQIGWGTAGQRLTSDPRPRTAAKLTPPLVAIATCQWIAGLVGYEMPYNHMLPYCLRMTWDREDGRTCDMYQLPESQLMPFGAIPFEFSLKFPDYTPVTRTLSPLFFSLHSVPDGRNPSLGDALSDTRAVLVELM